jgi:hypothetical protein
MHGSSTRRGDNVLSINVAENLFAGLSVIRYIGPLFSYLGSHLGTMSGLGSDLARFFRWWWRRRGDTARCGERGCDGEGVGAQVRATGEGDQHKGDSREGVETTGRGALIVSLGLTRVILIEAMSQEVFFIFNDHHGKGFRWLGNGVRQVIGKG